MVSYFSLRYFLFNIFTEVRFFADFAEFSGFYVVVVSEAHFLGQKEHQPNRMKCALL